VSAGRRSLNVAPLALAVALGACAVAIPLALSAAELNRQQPLPACIATPLAAPAEPNIFSPAQENELGDALAERFEAELDVIEDDALNAGLRRIGERLVRHLPPTELRIRFTLIDIPDANAFVLPGGRIYVTRKLVSFTRSEDELANVLAHELGHLLARQQTIQYTRLFKELAGVTSVTGRDDILAAYDKVMENAGRKPDLFGGERHEAREQMEADRLGLFVAAAAGYDPAAQATLFSRLAETGNVRRGFLSRLFGTATPDVRRLAELTRGIRTLPPGCQAAGAQPEPAAYRAWQVQVASFTGVAKRELLTGVVSRVQLAPFRGEVSRLRFSPDGRYVLAQDAGGVTVLDADPLAVRFHIEAPGARPAQFSQDSAAVLVHDASLRIERWSVADRALADVHDLFRLKPCLDTALSPDGRVLACVDLDSDLTLLDVASAQPIVQQRSFHRTNDRDAYFEILAPPNVRRAGELTMRFSPDSRFFIAAHQAFAGQQVFAYDFAAGAPITLRDRARAVVTGFAFLGADRFIAVDVQRPARSPVVRLPEGDVVAEVALPLGFIEAATDANYVLVRPHQQHALGVFDVEKRALVRTSATSAFDIRDGRYVVERGATDVGVVALDADRLVSQVTLPAVNLSLLRTSTVSPDFGWIALSERTRGVVWNAATGERVTYVRDFDGSFIDEKGTVYADLPAAGTQPRSLMKFEASSRALANAGPIADPFTRQYGQWLMTLRPLPFGRYPPEGMELVLRDVRSSTAAWARRFGKQLPDLVWFDAASDAIVVVWYADWPGGRDRVKQDAALRARVPLRDLEGDYVLEIIDAETGRDRGRVFVETGRRSFALTDAIVTGDRLLLSDTLGRVLHYSVSTGELIGSAFGGEPVVNAAGGMLAVDAGPGRIVFYDLATMKRRDELQFSRRVVHKSFNTDGSQLFVLTSDQVAYVVRSAR
jgi:hypothetical protein